MSEGQTRWEKYEDDLVELEAVLRANGPITAKQLAKKLGCTKPTIYSRLSALKDKGVLVATKDVRDGITGPLAHGFVVT